MYGHFDPLGGEPHELDPPKKEPRFASWVYIVAFFAVIILVLVGVMYVLPIFVT